MKLLTADLAVHLDKIESFKTLIEEVDFLHAKFKLAEVMQASRPKVSHSREINTYRKNKDRNVFGSKLWKMCTQPTDGGPDRLLLADWSKIRGPKIMFWYHTKEHCYILEIAPSPC